jgi:hypothetical protein
MSTKIFDVYITERSMYETFKLFADFHVEHAKDTHPETIDMFWSKPGAEPLKIEVVIIPLSSRRTIVKPIYGGYGGLEKTKTAEALKTLLDEHFTDYHYQNQSDRPEDVSPQEWNARKLNWDRLSDKYGLKYSDMGVVYTIWQPSELKMRVSNR